MRNAAISALLPFALLLACSGDDTPAVSATAGEETNSESNGTTTGASTTDPSAGSTETSTSTTSGGDPCLACDPNADCSSDGTCSCADGFKGDGKTCTDVDECATGQNSCDADAICANTPGSYTCTCNTGYKGNGMSCKDVDECTDGSNKCAPNATCTNNDGGYSCKCNEGFSGDGFSCGGGKAYGESCKDGTECNSGSCLLGTFNHCTQVCDFSKANDCRDEGAKGLCLPVGDDQFACAGLIDTGLDQDDEIVKAKTILTRFFDKIGDVDLFRLDLPVGNFLVQVTPDFDDDAKIEFYDLEGKNIGVINSAGAGGVEGVDYGSNGQPVYMLITNVGNTTGQYQLLVDNL
jgi:hypothetical protein